MVQWMFAAEVWRAARARLTLEKLTVDLSARGAQGTANSTVCRRHDFTRT